MIFRNSKWDLPKGKLEAGENIQECAIREVEEECGVRNLQIVNQLQSTYHTYQLNGKATLKCTYWFKMITNFNDELVPQIKEGITKVAWVDINDISEKYKIPGEVRDPLLMFIPSESVCADLYENFDDLFQKAYKLGIIIVSPNTLMLSVQTLQTLIRDAQMQKQIGIIKTEVGKILMDVDRLGIRVEDLQKHFNLANKDIENIVASSKKITSSGRKIQVLESNNSQETIEKN